MIDPQTFEAGSLCTKCEKAQARPGLRECAKCAEKRRAHDKAKYKRRVEAGRCIICGRPSAPGHVHCTVCAEKMRARGAARADTSRATGTCTRCNTAAAAPGRKFCLACAKRSTAWLVAKYADARTAGMCVTCKKEPALSSHVHCERCLDWRKAYYLNRLCKITPEQRAQRLAEQGGKCAICETTRPGMKGWQTDHEHSTGVFRALLCVKCNTRYGDFDKLDDLQDELNRARAYAEKYNLVGVLS